MKKFFHSFLSFYIFTEWLFIFSKEQEGSVYIDKEDKKGKFVSPGAMSTYKWFVPKRSAPGSQDSACVTWSYFSAVDSVKDTNSGLLGPLIICRKVHDMLKKAICKSSVYLSELIGCEWVMLSIY